jgi:hypothetical protein
MLSGTKEQKSTGWNINNKIVMTTAYKKALLRKYHSVCSELNLSPDEKEAIKESYGVGSSSDLSEVQLSHLIDKLLTGQEHTSLKDSESMWRKRVMASIGAWLRSIHKQDNADVIKAIACRASGYDKFNKIPVSRLRSIYYEFSHKAKSASATQQIKDDIIDYLKKSN